MSLLAVTSGDIASGVVEAEGIDLDGTYDYLSRSTDLVGNVDSKTFTFSAWVYITKNTFYILCHKTASRGLVVYSSSDRLVITAFNSAGTEILQVQETATLAHRDTFINLKVSIDLTDTGKRHIYINDVDRTSTFTFNTYINDTIDFTVATGTNIGARYDNTNLFKGRLSNIFLAYEYVDLSIESNRRMFITADGKPADGWKSLNPIIGMSMKDAATAHINEGTGGNFTANGTFATSNRGANQDNCVASYFDGVADYLSNTTLRASSSNFFTLSLVLNNSASTKRPFHFDRTGVACTDPVIDGSSSATGHEITFRPVDESVAVSCKAPSVQGKTTHISIAFDITNSSSFRMVVNGVAYNTYTTFVQGATIAVSSITNWFIGRGASFFQGNIGELYFDTKYIDLATNNPFWDSVENKPVPVRKVIANTGVTPLIAMPLDASNAGKNYGTGGDFTVNSGPYVGARGASEFWARSIKGNNTNGYLSRASVGASNSYTFSVTFASLYNGDEEILSFYTDSGNYFQIHTNAGMFTVLSLVGGAAKAIITDIAIGGVAMTVGSWYVAQLSFDMRNSALRNAYVNRVQVAPKYDTYVSSLLPFNTTSVEIGRKDKSLYFNSSLSFIYFTTDYIDFSQEVNRLKFVDGLGYPLDLKKQIDAGVIPKPLFYLPFDDPSNLGKDASGNNNHFTVNGTVTAGADFSL